MSSGTGKEGATRDAYGEALLAIGDDPRLVVLDAGVSDSTRTKKYGQKFPHRFFNMGISEGDMVCTAAGFATAGKVPFATSFACFLLGRSMDQVLVSLAYSNTNVKLVGTHSGLAVGEDGPTAQMIVDIAYTRAMPNMTVIQPADWQEAYQATLALMNHQGPAYLRLGRSAVKPLYDESYKFAIGKASVLIQAKDTVIFATGIMVQESLQAAEMLKKDGITAGVVNVSTLKPIDAATIREQAKRARTVVTAEDHNRIGGLGDAVAEVLVESRIHRPFKKVAVDDRFAETGDPQSLFDKYGLSAPSIVHAVKETLR